jgi:hypothetical protein
MAKISDTPDGIDAHLLRLLIPEEILACFKLGQVIENDEELLFDLVEKETCVPKVLQGKEAVLNGYMNGTTLQSFPQKGKKCYIYLRRRRWKAKGDTDNKGYFNDYEFTAPGTMATKSFGAFLKRNSLIATPSHLAQSL